MSGAIDLQFRPKTYFRPEKLEKYVLSKVKGAVLLKKLKALFEAGRHDEVGNLVGKRVCSAADRKVLEPILPMFMGGNYLPDTENGEVEIARISIRSATSDVTRVYARPEDGTIHYRVVDGSGCDTLPGSSETTTTEPMTLEEFADFFLTVWPLIDVLKMNHEDNLNGALRFFSADSDFYPEFDHLCRQRVSEHFPRPGTGDVCPFCEYVNSPPANDLCKHAVAWVWKGQFEALVDTSAFESALQDLAELVNSTAKSSPIRVMLTAQARRNTIRQALIDSASLPLKEALETLASAKSGDGWSTNGAPGDSGHTICVSDPSELSHLTSECRAILKACGLNIQTETNFGENLQDRRPESVEWELVASGFWEQGLYHSGYIAYYIASPEPGCWVMEGRQRDAILDGVTEEDVEEGRLNDDQSQALWGQTLEEAQNSEYKHIVAWSEGVEPDCTGEEMAAVLYRAVCKDGGMRISERDDDDGLLKF